MAGAALEGAAVVALKWMAVAALRCTAAVLGQVAAVLGRAPAA
ncbi:hypothetical protein ABZW11_44125 [Nonomuraea sp. NPDC004580]